MKKGVSPIIATVILIAIVIILAVIVFLWARGFITERSEKFGRAVELSCPDVNFEAGVFCTPGCELEVVNRGNVPLYGFKIKEIGQGTVLTTSTLDKTVSIGQSDIIPLSDTSLGEELLVVPIILGETGSGKVAHTCADEFGFETTASS